MPRLESFSRRKVNSAARSTRSTERQEPVKAAEESLSVSAYRAAELAQNPVARSLLAAGLVTAASALAANKKVRESARRGARQARDAAEAAADAAADSANKIGAAMISAATDAVRRMMSEAGTTAHGEAAAPGTLLARDIKVVETSAGAGLGDRLSADEGLARIELYARPRPIEAWAGKVAGAGEIEERLGIARSTLNEWRKRGTVIGLLRGERKFHYPLEQFVDARPLEGMRAVSAAAGDTSRAWLWLRQPHPRFEMDSPLHALRRGDIKAVVEAAERDFG